VLDLDSGEFLENTTYGLAVLDSNSQKTPATFDAGSCDVTNGCLNVSVVGRGDNFFLRENGTKSGLNQTLQQADFTLLKPSSCLLYDRDIFGYDFYYAYAAAYYGCPDLDCANKTQVVNSATYFNDYYLDTQRDYVDTREAQFQAGNATCLQNLDAGICTNDVGAPVFIDDDTLVGIVLSNLCEFEGEYGVKPVSVTFTQAIIGAIETELQSILGADGTLLKAQAGSCTCVDTNSPTKSPTDSPTKTPTKTPTESPTGSPTRTPTSSPTNSPTNSPTKTPTNSPTDSPMNSPTDSPTNPPTITSTAYAFTPSVFQVFVAVALLLKYR